MKAVILAGGYGTRIMEESATRPKPMIEIGGRPILWHIMKIYAAHGVNDFVICCGYKGYMIKEYFANYVLHSSDVTFDLANDAIESHGSQAEPWRVTLIDTGEETMTGGRLRRVRRFVEDGTFFMTYGDGVSDIDVAASLEHHRASEALATMTAVQPPGRFGVFKLDPDQERIHTFSEKPAGDGTWVNGGYFVLEPGVFDYIEGDHTVWERDPLERLAAAGQLNPYRHAGYWQNMDTIRDRAILEAEWASERPAWKQW